MRENEGGEGCRCLSSAALEAMPVNGDWWGGEASRGELSYILGKYYRLQKNI